MSIVIRTDFETTQYAWRLRSLLDISLVDFAQNLLKIETFSGSQLSRVGWSSDKFYWTKSFPDANTPDPIAYSKEIVESRKHLLEDSEFGNFFKITRIIIDVNELRFEYQVNAIGELVLQ